MLTQHIWFAPMDLHPPLPPLPPSWWPMLVAAQPAATWRELARRDPHVGMAVVVLDRLEAAEDA